MTTLSSPVRAGAHTQDISALGSGGGVQETAPPARQEHLTPSPALRLNQNPAPTAPIGQQSANGLSEAVKLDASQFEPAPSPRASLGQLDSFLTLQKWEGYVMEVSDTTFWAYLVRIEGEGPDQEAEIPVGQVALSDRPLLAPGAIFYWVIGYRVRKGQRIRDNILRFRRLPRWSEHDLMRARAEAQAEVEESRHLFGDG